MQEVRRVRYRAAVRARPAVLVPALSVLLLSACSTDATGGARVATYTSLDALKAAYLSAGGTCRGWTEDDDIRAAAQSGTCAGGIELSTYLNGADLLGQVTLLRDTASGGDDGSTDPPRTELLIGTDWLVSGEHVRALQPKLGGQLAVINPAASS